jgi:amino acid transporter
MTSSSASAPRGAPARGLTVLQGAAFVVGVVIGVGIFRTPQLVAANVDTELAFLAVWLAGGIVTLIGALCYAELAASRPHEGGEYRFLSDAFGLRLGVMFAWARGTVIQTGAIAAVAFVFGDYASQLYSLGDYSASIYAAIVVAAVTAINVAGTPRATWTQSVLTAITVGALVFIIVAGLSVTSAADLAPAAPAPAPSAGGAIGLAMVFILLTYGGWNEAAYLSAEVRNPARDVVRILVLGTLVLIALYVLVNFAYLRVFGLEGLRDSEAVAADFMNRVVGPQGAALLSVAICITALSTLNATVFTGARVYSALGRDVRFFRRFGDWDEKGRQPVNAILLQGAITLGLVALGAITRDGFKAMVDYTAPVFWFFLLLVGISLFIFRSREGDDKRPFKVPLYPITPALFVMTCAYMLYSSLAYTGVGALVGIGVLLLGTPLLLLSRNANAPAPAPAAE